MSRTIRTGIQQQDGSICTYIALPWQLEILQYDVRLFWFKLCTVKAQKVDVLGLK